MKHETTVLPSLFINRHWFFSLNLQVPHPVKHIRTRVVTQRVASGNGLGCPFYGHIEDVPCSLNCGLCRHKTSVASPPLARRSKFGHCSPFQPNGFIVSTKRETTRNGLLFSFPSCPFTWTAVFLFHHPLHTCDTFKSQCEKNTIAHSQRHRFHHHLFVVHWIRVKPIAN